MEKTVELWDAYNADGTKAGFDLIRGEDIPYKVSPRSG